ncbi:MAG: hypothetical protein ACRDPO_18305 [Streptosporangiaceae bacterium]
MTVLLAGLSMIVVDLGHRWPESTTIMRRDISAMTQPGFAAGRYGEAGDHDRFAVSRRGISVVITGEIPGGI